VISPDYDAMVISHNRLLGSEQGSPSRRYVLQLSAIVTRFSDAHKTVEIPLADPVFDPQRQISRKFFWCPER
jgi:hypothetical protein